MAWEMGVDFSSVFVITSDPVTLSQLNKTDDDVQHGANRQESTIFHLI